MTYISVQYQCFDEPNEHMIQIVWVKFIQKLFVQIGNGPERSVAQNIPDWRVAKRIVTR